MTNSAKNNAFHSAFINWMRDPKAALPAPHLPTRETRNIFMPVTSQAQAARYQGGRALYDTVRDFQYLAQMLSQHPHGNPDHVKDGSMPAGYTYLGQLIAHDISRPMRLAFGFSKDGTAAKPPFDEKQNQAFGPLTLTSIFGPLGSERPGLDIDEKGRLRLYRFTSRLRGVDLRRYRQSEQTHSNVFDRRNDDNPMVAQISALFIALQNKLVDFLHETHEDIDPITAYWQAVQACAYCFRNIVKQDYLKTVLNPQVYEFYAGQSRVRIDQETTSDALPVEFNQGVFRFGHALVRDAYRLSRTHPPILISDLVGVKPDLIEIRQRVPNFWEIDWSAFFDVGAQPAQRARAIAPNVSAFFANLDRSGFSIKTDGNWQHGIIQRDLTRNALCGPLKVRELAKHVRPFVNGGFDHAIVFADMDDGCGSDVLANEIRSWISQQSVEHIPEDVIDHIAADPPLTFFTLFEASLPMARGGGDGKYLGVLGSIIMAETLLGTMSATLISGDAITTFKRFEEARKTTLNSVSNLITLIT